MRMDKIISTCQTFHSPVMLRESIALLNVREGGVYVDATLGGGGHAQEILQSGYIQHLYAFDQDAEAIAYAEQRLNPYLTNLTLIQANFEHLRTLLALKKVKGIDGILFDFGVSSHQLDTASRGFSADKDGTLDMRMSDEMEQSAQEFLNQASKEEITKVLLQYGEEKVAARIAGWIVKYRAKKPLSNTSELSRLIEANLHINPAFVYKTKVRVFQALRIHINRELEVLKTGVQDAINLLNRGGRIVTLTYHSLEDKQVKTIFNKAVKGCICPPAALSCVCNQKPRLKLLTAKPLIPSPEEIQQNNRARSAKLRAAEKI